MPLKTFKCQNFLIFILLILLVSGCSQTDNSTAGTGTRTLEDKTNNIDAGTSKNDYYKLNLEQVKTECRLTQQILRAGLMWRFVQLTAGNNINNEAIKEQAEGIAVKTLGKDNVNIDAINNLGDVAAVYGSQLSRESIAAVLAQGTIKEESKCVDSSIMVQADDGSYPFAKNGTIINWDKTSNTDWQIKTIYDN